ncbi:MAG: hypothetical protein SO401_02095 [Blautia sp.]|nr:hypothetical protein [Blautia sp.]
MKKYRIYLTVFCGLLACLLVSGCGKKKEQDAESSQVIPISAAPEVTPTPELSQINPDAVVTNGNLTMVNEYLARGDRDDSQQ